ncbi:DUF7747 domain-containing protein [Caenorhabditis elegans]|uniref:OTU domain-containing protein n=1 Tax=Caenorhabditis elegans TaxID=6239 RepID=V6CL97_CAEEL|nr:OTU domain-containing protein [Caenorhabditis elegans]CDK13334.1 OTU domain-containing protein [Caenorhabditis elegans]|eukprot:NP_001293167.1 Uncharacterized protein CELE_Y48G1C.8 [Caenorhabditis elegans]
MSENPENSGELAENQEEVDQELVQNPTEPQQNPEPAEEPQQNPEPAAEPQDPATKSRPRRNARKSVLYNNEDYELGIPKEEALASASTSSIAAPKRSRTEESTVRNAKKRKPAPHLEELTAGELGEPIFAGDDSMLHAETEVIVEDEPPILNLSRYRDEDRIQMDPFGDDEEEDDGFMDGQPPDLEMNLPSKQRRVRTRKPMDTDGSIDDGDKEKKAMKIINPAAATPSKMFRVQGERVISKALAERQYHVKLFEDEVEMTENGDCYATVISGCLAYLLRKERIIELLTNETEIAMIREGGWLLDKPPRLPPLVPHKACFAFYVDGSKIMSIKDVSNDDLKPWSSTGGEQHFNDPVIKPNVRRHPVARLNGRLQSVKGDPRIAELHLTEYSAWLPRLLRLRKKIFYLSRDGQIYGNVLILYDYTCPGEIPPIVNLPHGNDYLRHAMVDPTDPHVSLDLDDPGSTPFEDEIVEGPRGGMFLRVKLAKLGWAHNKKLLLRYLVNEPELLSQSNCLNRRTPYLPPLIPTTGVFVYFVPANFVANQINHTGDGLSPWTVNPASEGPSPRVRSTRRAIVQDDNGQFQMAKDTAGGWHSSQLCLVETMSVLARCPRLRKRLIYIQRNNTITIGNVCYIYEYVRDGPVPCPYVKPPGTPGRGVGGSKWIDDQKKIDTSQDPSTSSAAPNDEEQFIDVEDLEVVEEEVIGHHNDSLDQIQLQHDQHQQQQHQLMQDVSIAQDAQGHLLDDDLLDMSQEDVLNNGYDLEFDDDPLTQQENPAPYFENPRQLETGHIYLTVRHKRVASTFEAVLEWIANTNVVEERGLLNYAKPGHPPIVRNSRAYAFFVAGTAIFPHDINRDDFSPWSHNGNAQNPTCYRTKVRKVGVICDELGSQFQTKDNMDYKTCPFHLVFLYSINPREPRLRKKIYYMMETESRLVVSHALIMYDYNQEGELPRMHGGYLKRFAKRATKRPPTQIHDIDNDVSDMSECEKECPFAVPAQAADDGSLYLQLLDMEFWNDRNRQLHFLVNKPSLIESLGCLNNRVPALPPATTGKAAFVFFIDGLEVDARNLTCDGLVPWSENTSTNPHGITKRPKSAKQALALNREGQLRIWKTPSSHRSDLIEFQLHVYTATLPRCPRLRKKVTYVLKNGHQIGNAMIIYWYTEPGEMPAPVNVSTMSSAQEYSLQRLPPHIREDVLRLLARMTPAEVAKVILEKYGIQVNTKMLYYVRRREIMAATDGIRDAEDDHDPYELKNEMIVSAAAGDFVDDWTTDTAGASAEASEGGSRKKNVHLEEMLDERELQVSHTEEIQQPSSSQQQIQLPYRKAKYQEPKNFGQQSSGLPLSQSGMARGTSRNEALFRIAKNSFGSATDNETFDLLFKMLFEKSEHRLLQIVNHTFGVEIMAGEEMDNGEMHLHMAPDGAIVEEIVEEEVIGTVGDDVNLEEEVHENEPKVYTGEKQINDVLEQVVVEEPNHHDDHPPHELLEEDALVNPDDVIVDPNQLIIHDDDDQRQQNIQ